MFEINGCYSVYRESLSDVLALFFVVLSDLNFLSHHKSPGNPIKMTDHVLFSEEYSGENISQCGLSADMEGIASIDKYCMNPQNVILPMFILEQKESR